MYFLGVWWQDPKSAKDLNTNNYTHQKYGMESSTLRGCVWDRSEFHKKFLGVILKVSQNIFKYPKIWGGGGESRIQNSSSCKYFKLKDIQVIPCYSDNLRRFL